MNKPLLLLVAAALLSSPIEARAATSSVSGIPNFHEVTQNLLRGGQPDTEGWASLAGLGVKTVVDLRRPIEHSTAAESTAVVAAGMRYVNFPMNGFETPTAAQIESSLALLDTGEKVFVHCKRGRDRTGTVIAAYRISRQGWENQKALAEAKSLGLQWFSVGMKRFISGYRPEPVAAKMATPRLADTQITSELDSLAVE